MPEHSVPAYIWSDGAVVPWAEARLHVWSDALCGINVFEGLRGYWRAGERRHYLLHLDRHLRRLEQSARAIRVPFPYDAVHLAEGMFDLLAALEYEEHVYLRPTILLERGRYEVAPQDIVVRVFVPAFAVPDRSGECGVRCAISSWRRPSDLALPPRVKAGANYYNVRLARLEATERGFDEAILLDEHGKVAETGGAAVFLAREGQLVTPAVTSGILESITRHSAIVLAREVLDLEVVERPVDRSELYVADEIFLTGTLAEVTPVHDVDGVTVGGGRPGEIAGALASAYRALCAGEGTGYEAWMRAGPVIGRAARRSPCRLESG